MFGKLYLFKGYRKLEVYNSVNLIPNSIDSSSVTMGTFDGMHQGHIYLIKEMLNNSMINDNKSVLITFHPMAVA